MAWAIKNTKPEYDWSTEYWHRVFGFSPWELTRFTDEEKAIHSLPENGEWMELPATHTFGDTGDAYDDCQCSALIAEGDTLIIESEGVIGLAYAWPIAVTVEAGKLHRLQPDHSIIDTIEGITEDQVRQAVKAAAERGYPIAPEFDCYKEA